MHFDIFFTECERRFYGNIVEYGLFIHRMGESECYRVCIAVVAMINRCAFTGKRLERMVLCRSEGAVRTFCRYGNRCIKGDFAVDIHQYVEVVFSFGAGNGMTVWNRLFPCFLYRYGKNRLQFGRLYRIIEAELYIVCRFRNQVVGIDGYPPVGVFPQHIAGLGIGDSEHFAGNGELPFPFYLFSVERLYAVFNGYRVFLSGFKAFCRFKSKVPRAVPAEYAFYGWTNR